MKSATVREVQHHLNRVLKWVERGEQVRITRRKQMVAKIVPPEEVSTKMEWPDFAARRKKFRSAGWRGAPLSQIIDEGRGTRP